MAEQDYRPIADAPRDSTWIDLRYRNGGTMTTRMGRSCAYGEKPGVWRFAAGGNMPYADEGGWEWRPLDAEIAELLVAEEAGRADLRKAA